MFQYESINLPYDTYYGIDNELPPIISPELTSPRVSTPYLDSSIDTPHLDKNSTSPFLDTVPDSSPYLMFASLGSVPSYLMNGLKDIKEDVYVDRYIDGYHFKVKQEEPSVKFNGDPTALLIDKTKLSESLPTPTTPSVKLEPTIQDASDSLFPPLTSSQQSSDSYHAYIETEEYSNDPLEDILQFSSPLSEPNADFDTQEEEVPSFTTQVESPASHEVSRKRKSDDQDEFILKPTTKKQKNTTAKASKKNSAKEPTLYQCPLCDHVSKRRYNLTTHIKTHDKLRVKEFNCTQCSKRFDRRHDRDRHLATVHSREKSFACQHCSANFSRRDAFERHLIQKHNYDEDDLAK